MNDADAADRVVEAARKKFGVERLDALVNVVEEGQEDDMEGFRKLSKVAGAAMAKEGQGSITNVLGAGKDREAKSKPVVR